MSLALVRRTEATPAPRLQRCLDRIARLATAGPDVDRAAIAIGDSLAELLHPARYTVLLAAAGGGTRVLAAEGDARTSRSVPLDAPLPPWAATLAGPVTRERLPEDPAGASLRAACLRTMDSVDAEILAPIGLGSRLAGLVVLGPRRCGSPYADEDLRTLGVLASHGAVALEQLRTRMALEAAQAQLDAALRRVETLEGIRANLGKFVPATVRTLVEHAPDALPPAKRTADVSVLFVDIVGYTALSGSSLAHSSSGPSWPARPHRAGAVALRRVVITMISRGDTDSSRSIPTDRPVRAL